MKKYYYLHEEFEQFCESLGQTKTVATERALQMYMDTMKQNPDLVPEDIKPAVKVLVMNAENSNKEFHKSPLRGIFLLTKI